MSEFTLSDLLARFEGWTVRSVVDHGELSIVRLGTQVEGLPDWFGATAVVFTERLAAPDDVDIVGEPFSGVNGSVNLGSFVVGQESLLAGQMLEERVLVVPSPFPDPVSSPTQAVEVILAEGNLVWPLESDLPDSERGTEPLEGETKTNLIQPSLAISATLESEEGEVRFDMFMGSFVAIETARSGADQPMFVSFFPLFDLPGRLLDRSGLGRLISPGRRVGRSQTVALRSTFLTDDGLMLGGLTWEEDSGGRLTTQEGEITAQALTSEALRIVPGGDVEVSQTEGVVGEE